MEQGDQVLASEFELRYWSTWVSNRVGTMRFLLMAIEVKAEDLKIYGMSQIL